MQGANLAVTREIDGGLEMINVKMPCVITADLRYGVYINLYICCLSTMNDWQAIKEDTEGYCGP